MCPAPHASRSGTGSHSMPFPRPGGEPTVSPIDIMTILIHCIQSRDRDCSRYDTLPVRTHLPAEFPAVPRDALCDALRPRVRVPRYAYLTGYQRCGTNLRFIASTPRAVCHHRCISPLRVCAGRTRAAKSPWGEIRLQTAPDGQERRVAGLGPHSGPQG